VPSSSCLLVSDSLRSESNLEQEIKKTREELSEKIDEVAADLKAHRSDTEIHRQVSKTRE